MRFARKLILMIMVSMLGACLLLAGCNVAKKPYTPTPQTSKKTEITTPTPTTTNAMQVANRSAAEANKVAGVNKATAVITGKNMYIGLDLNAKLGKDKVAAVEKTVLSQVKKMEPSYTIIVTSDVDTVTRIKEVSQGVAQGKPISSFSKELQDINTRTKPMVK